MPFYDAHNHLQDERLQPHWPKIEAQLWPEGSEALIAGMVVNGSCETDWQHVLDLSRRHPQIIPSFGYHPWYIRERTSRWRETLVEFLDATPSAVGEIGLDRWMPNPDLAGQEEVFLFQLQLAAERNLPVTIHCLQAWGRLQELLQTHRGPDCGFLLHSYGGSAEMVRPLAELGAFFSFPGYFAHPRKERQRAAFRLVPRDRLLIETDAPDQLPPENWNRHPLNASDGKPLNHPANLLAIYEFAAEFLARPLPELTDEVEANFLKFFGPVLEQR